MPIRPENKARYPRNWKSEVVPRIRARSGNRCECTGQCGITHQEGWHSSTDMAPDRCGIPNGDITYLGPSGRWQVCLPSELGDEMEVKDGKIYRAIRIVLTVMHLNHEPEDCHDANLLHACQNCHNRYDAPMRAAGIKERARVKRASGDLFQCEGL